MECCTTRAQMLRPNAGKTEKEPLAMLCSRKPRTVVKMTLKKALPNHAKSPSLGMRLPGG